MDAKLTITGLCDGGGHVLVDVETKEGKKRLSFLTENVLSPLKDDVRVDSEHAAVLKEIKKAVQIDDIKQIEDVITKVTDLQVKL